jgi:hypothetical protein
MVPAVYITLVLALSTSKVSVQNLGVDRRDIVSLTELKADFMALSCRMHGSISMIANLFRNLTADEAARIEKGMPHGTWKKSSA